MKKLLAMVLALVMTLSLAVSANAFKDDKSISDDYAEAVAVLNGMGVFKGYEDGSFQPKGDITRAEVSAIVYRVYTQDVKDAKASMYATYNKFSDMAGAGWAQGYIGYCANAELVKGYPDGTFKPSGKVTGYEVLAMILRAVGYDKNNEFSGADWALHVAQTAQQAGVLKNVKGIDLNAPATRELVAELLFRAIAEASTVTYTPAFGYVTDKVLGNAAPTLGYKNFKLVGAADADKWGRPATKWTYNVGDKSTLVVAKADASYTTKVSECDIAKDLGLTKEAKLEAAFIDGKAQPLISELVTSNRYASIDPKATTSYVGAQGRITEAYDMGAAGVRLVEINTYFAQVTAVTAAKTDKNGHVTAATATFNVFQTAHTNAVTAYTFETDGFTVGQYALVKIVDPTNTDATKRYIAEAVVATAAASDVLKGFTPATTTLGTTVYNDADKFNYGYTKNVADVKKAYDVYVDEFGNVIALTDTAKNYLVVEGINWIPDGTVYGGKAVADVVLADGTRVPGVTVASVNGKPVNNQVQSSYLVEGNPAEAVVVAYAQNNAKYYKHLTTYTVDANGNYNLGYNDNTICCATDMSGANISPNTSTIKNGTNSIVVNNSTVFLVANKTPGATITTYTTYNKSNVPAMTGADLCYLTDIAGWATVVLVTDYDLASNTFAAYVPADNGVVKNYVAGKGYEYSVYKLGETTATPVYSENHPLVADGQDGFYMLTVNSDGVVDNASKTWFMGTYDTTTSGTTYPSAFATYYWDRAYVKAVTPGSLQLKANPAGTFADYDTTVKPVTYILVDKCNGLTTLTGDAAASVVADAKVIVGYTKDTYGNKLAAYVYVIKTSDTAQNPDADATVDKLALTHVGTSYTATLTKGAPNTNVVDGTTKIFLQRVPVGETAWETVAEMTGSSGNYTATYANVGNNVKYEMRAVAMNGETVIATSTSFVVYG